MQKIGMICVMTLLCGGLLFAQHDKQKPANKASEGKGSVDKNSEERNKATARRVFDDLWTSGRTELISSMYESNAIVHIGNRSAPLSEVVSEGKEMRQAFPDLVVTAHRVSANGDMVDVAWSAHGTNRGHERGYPGKGKPAKTQGTSKFKFNGDGKIAEVWVDWNEQDVRRQVAGK